MKRRQGLTDKALRGLTAAVSWYESELAGVEAGHPLLDDADDLASARRWLTGMKAAKSRDRAKRPGATP